MNVWGKLVVAVVAVTAASCAQTGPMPNALPVDETSVDVDYELGTGDRVLVTVFGHEDLSGEFAVDGAGNISPRLIGNVEAAALTSQELADTLEERYRAGYLSAPQITVEVLEYRPYYILGEVNSPGSYPFTSGLTVMNAVATAQGFTYRADARRVYVKHAGDINETPVTLSAGTPVYPGDTIRIPERRF